MQRPFDGHNLGDRVAVLELVVFSNVAGIDSTQHEDSHGVFMVYKLSVVSRSVELAEVSGQ